MNNAESSLDHLTDEDARKEALNIHHSYIVQAPAGSGKTELLMQRYLSLLAYSAEEPEEVLAITFTNKAASEMRERILNALHKAATEKNPPEEKHLSLSWNLAKVVLQQNEKRQWDILNNPSRLRIQTIDALCGRLVKSIPILSGFGGSNTVTTNGEPLYEQAVSNLLMDLESPTESARPLKTLLSHLHNDMEKVHSLLIELLQRREQWIAPVMENRDFSISLQNSLRLLIEDHLKPLYTLFSSEEKATLLRLARFAAYNIQFKDPNSPINSLLDIENLPERKAENLSLWKAIASFLLTDEGKYRKQVTVSQGFPAASSTKNKDEKESYDFHKKLMTEFLNNLSPREDLRQALNALNLFPSHEYEERHLRILEAIFNILPSLLVHLKFVFKEQGVVDFSEITQGANIALGEENNPTDLALALDYQLRHILVDEFQDTSLTQYGLLKKLTAGWLQNDGRTLFLVGDPMQSIYRFRQAEVSLFLQAKQSGLGYIPLKSLILSNNYRSSETVVEWINNAFTEIFPKNALLEHGAIPYHRSQATHDKLPHSLVALHSFMEASHEEQSAYLAKLIEDELAQFPEQSIGILVKARSNLYSLLLHLKHKKIPFSAVEIEALDTRPLIKDLLSLSGALLHEGDRLSWLSLLRSPLMGLTLRDLHVLTKNTNITIFQAILSSELEENLSEHGKSVLQRIKPLLTLAMAQKEKLPVRQWIEQTWFSLGGVSVYNTEVDIIEMTIFLEKIEELSQEKNPLTLALLNKAIESLYASSVASQDCKLHIMTVHKSKGLEFDTVILPSLQSAQQAEKSALLNWMKQNQNDGSHDILFSANQSLGKEVDPLQAYMLEEDKRKNHYERARLLYVAATRARKRLHLCFSLKKNKAEEIIAPSKSSLCAFLWPLLDKNNLQIKTLDKETIKPLGEEDNRDDLCRLPQTWQLPSTILLPEITESSTQSNKPFVYHSPLQQQVGTYLHRLFKEISITGIPHMLTREPTKHLSRYSMGLLQIGLPKMDVPLAMPQIEQALGNIHEDPKAHWIFNPHHLDAKSEYPLTYEENGNTSSVIVDRTFVDNGQRWIIDYKLSAPKVESLEAFYAHSFKQYREQLEFYAKIFYECDNYNCPIKLGLYFPLFKGWYEWEYSPHER